MAYIESYRNQNYLLPPNIKDLFPEDHVCYLIEQITDSLDYSDFDKQYAGAGHPAYHPRIILKLLLIANAEGIKSSRKIAKNAYQNIVYIYLSEKTSPDFRTISDFRKDNKELLKQTQLQLLKFGVENNLIDLSNLITDGTVIKADANKNKTVDKETLEKLNKWIEKIINEGIEIDEKEDELYGERGIHQLPKEFDDNEKRKPIVKQIVEEINKAMKEKSKEKADQVKQEVNQLKQELDKKDLKKYNKTDPDARFMRHKKFGTEIGYNAQVVVDKNGIILDDNVVQDADDRNQLLPNINSVEENFKLPKDVKVLADKGYEKAKDLKKLDDRGYDLYVPGKETDKSKFKYDENRDTYISPNGEILKKIGTYFNKKRGERLTIYKGIVNGKERVIHAIPEDKLLNQIKEKLKTGEGKKIFSLRKQTVERSFGDIKQNRNFRSFSLRGLDKVRSEFKLACLGSNFVRMNNIIHKPPG